VFAAGIIFLEIIALQEVNGLYDSLYPMILSKTLPESLLLALRSSLAPDPSQRTTFQEIFDALSKDDTSYDKVDGNSGALETLVSVMDFDEVSDGLSAFSESLPISRV
jgi:hypothetical protein